MQRRRLIAASAAALVTAGSRAQAVKLAGVEFPPAVAVAGSLLALNGAGIRYKFVVKVYAAGLYLATRATTTEAVLGERGPKRLQVVMLREIDSEELGRLFTRGMQENSSQAEFMHSIPGTLRMADIFSSRHRLYPGDDFSVDWVPGQGTVIRVKGQVQGEPIREPEFFAALMRIWLGPNPADGPLKRALLGEAGAPARARGEQ